MSDKPKALVLAEKLEHQVHRGSYDWERVEPMMLKAAAELRRLHSDNEQLAEFVVAVGGFWGHTRSKLVGEDSLAECINRGDNDEALLKQALEALERTTPMGFNMESDKKFYAAITALRERLNLTKGA
jgi:hypothetical protein